ncbi:MAG: aminotransferase class V-fold PLP-dependent enzyme [Patescibacteria group bacterium]|jgi:radical SAM superfamily enzyme YgiQ (UPF0313 family)
MHEKLDNLEPSPQDDKGPILDAQEESDIEAVRRQQAERIQKELTPTEQKYFSAEQEFNTPEYLAFLRDRDIRIEKQAKQNLSTKNIPSPEEYELALKKEIHKLKYFSVLFISSPHVGEEVNGYFPGEPTPLMYATSVLDRYVRTDTFPADTSPEVMAMMNPGQFDDGFVQQLIERVTAEKPRVVGISNTSEGHFFAREIAKIIKMHSPETIIILGGAHEDGVNAEAYLGMPISEQIKTSVREQVTLHEDEAKKLFDIVVSGDAPYALVEILKIIANNRGKSNREITEEISKRKDIFRSIEGVGNVSVLNDENQIETASLSGLPLDWNKLPLMFRGRLTTDNRFPIFNGKKTAQIMTQMGCKYHCSFCMESLSGDLYKTDECTPPTVEKALKEIEILIRDYGYGAIFFDDSTFTQAPRQTMKLMDGIINLEKQDLKFEWGCQTTFADIPSQEFLEKMQQAGCTYIYFGFEQIEEQIRGKGKKVKTKKVEEVLAWCKEINLRTGISLQFGLEGLGNYKETIDYIAELYSAGLLNKNSIAININTPYPGTKEWLDLEKKPDFNQKLERHPRFESANQLSNLSMEKVNEIYAYARQKIGDGLIGVEYSNQEIQQHLEKYRKQYEGDFYFDSAQYGQYLAGQIDGLNLNHASMTNQPNQAEIINQLTAKFSEEDWRALPEQAREEAAKLIGVKKEGVIFGRNTTEAMKLISWLIGLKKGDRVMLTNAENISIVRLFEVNMDHGNPSGEDPWSTYPTFYRQRQKKYGDTVDEFSKNWR